MSADLPNEKTRAIGPYSRPITLVKLDGRTREAAPRPWVLRTDGVEDETWAEIDAPEWFCIAKVVQKFQDDLKPYERRMTEQARANAALIVAAVNAFDPDRERRVAELVTAARHLLAVNPVFRSRPVGAPNSPARAEQLDRIAAEDAVRAALKNFGDA